VRDKCLTRRYLREHAPFAAADEQRDPREDLHAGPMTMIVGNFTWLDMSSKDIQSRVLAAP
jgi:hypothetical protein